MTPPHRQSPAPPQPLEYAGRPPADARTSRLAVAALTVALLASPCILGPLTGWLNKHLPLPFNQTGRYGFVQSLFIRGALLLATALPVAALIRIGLSRRTRTGMGIAVLAFLISLLWWLLVYMAYSMWSRMRMD